MLHSDGIMAALASLSLTAEWAGCAPKKIPKFSPAAWVEPWPKVPVQRDNNQDHWGKPVNSQIYPPTDLCCYVTLNNQSHKNAQLVSLYIHDTYTVYFNWKGKG